MINEFYAKKFCAEDISLIQNYEQAIADNTQTWECHHRLEIQGKFINSPKLLKKCGLYDNVPAWQLIFLTKSEHRRLHMFGNTNRRGKRHSTEARRKMSEAHRGKPTWNKGKIGVYSAETIKKISKTISGTHWWNNGIVCKQAKECPGPEWQKGRLPYTRKMKKSRE